MQPLSGRQPVHARNVVATSQPLATQAGLEMLRLGGSAVDAAIAAAVCLTVVEPTSNGIGGDLFAIVNDGDDLVGLNASGRSPAAWTPDRFAGLDKMPWRGWDSVTVPGCVAGWVDLSDRFGRLPVKQLLEPAIRQARYGFPVSPITADAWKRAETVFREPAFVDTFLPAPAAGEVWRSEGHASTLQAIADSKGESFYRGDLARQIVAASDAGGGSMTLAELASHENLWHTETELMRTNALGVSLYEMPPNGQGIAACLALGICQRLDCDDWHSEQGLHLQIEAMKLAFADLHTHVADLDVMPFDPAALLYETYLDERAKLIDRERATTYAAGVPTDGGTVNLVASDERGLMVS
ncbi:MAG: gamma-glutamyltransferase, partial [Planctomycetota bacterium]